MRPSAWSRMTFKMWEWPQMNKPGLSRRSFLPCAPIVIAGIPSDVRHVDCHALAIPNKILGNFSTEFRTVNIPVNSPDWLEGPEPVQNLDRPEVACVPNLVAFGEMPENSVVQKPVCVGEQPDSQSSAYAPHSVRQNAAGDH